jgi:tetratricopeptide (TPR) repeat protein
MPPNRRLAERAEGTVRGEGGASGGPRKTVGLVMIVKNEEQTLPRLAASLRGQLDRWTIVDTGSTDRTVKLIPEVFSPVPGQLIEDAFRGYGPSRNVALEAARGHTDWLLTLDADETVEGAVRPALDAHSVDALEAELHYAPLRYWRPFLLASSADWHWEGRAHEYLTLGDTRPRLSRTTSFRVVHHADGGNRDDKLERELALLLADLEDKPEDPRTVFYLARTYEDLGRFEEAARAYRRRVGLIGWDEEAWYARWRLGCCLLAMARHDEAVGVLFQAWGERPWRAEPLWSLAEHHRSTGQWRLAWEAGMLARRHTAARPDGSGPSPHAERLFVHEDVYGWRMAYERSISAFYVGERSVGRRLCDYLLGVQLPPEIRSSVEQNRRFYA